LFFPQIYADYPQIPQNTFGLGFLESFCQIILPKAGKKIRVIRVIRVRKIRVTPLKIRVIRVRKIRVIPLKIRVIRVIRVQNIRVIPLKPMSSVSSVFQPNPCHPTQAAFSKVKTSW
jgi:hypothetical protein